MNEEQQERIARVRCDHCHKPFHIAASRKSEEPGEDEVKLNCPYCETPLVVMVPRAYLKPGVIFRGVKRA